MTFISFDKGIENITKFKILGSCFIIFVVCVAAIATLTALLITEKKGCHDEKGETTTMMTTTSTQQSSLIPVTTRRMTTSGMTTATSTSSTRRGTSTTISSLYWTTDSYFNQARIYFDAVVFSNGVVVACGGSINGTSVTSTCEFYGSSVNWRYGTEINSYRNYHTLTLFASKTKILATGTGAYWNNDLQIAEVYSVATDRWIYTLMNMTTSRFSHSAILLKNEQILIIGGMNSSFYPLSSAELFLTTSNSFIGVNSMNVARTSCTSTLLTDGFTVLVTGGYTTNFVSTASAELYTSGSWTFTSNSMTGSRTNHAAVLLQDGNVLIAGGTYNTFRSSATAEIYNTTTRTFTSVGSMKYRRADFTLTLLPSGKVLATGGIDWLTSTYPTTCELYDPITQTWSDTRVLRTGRRSPVTVLLADSVLTMGGCTDEYNYLTSCERYRL